MTFFLFFIVPIEVDDVVNLFLIVIAVIVYVNVKNIQVGMFGGFFLVRRGIELPGGVDFVVFDSIVYFFSWHKEGVFFEFQSGNIDFRLSLIDSIHHILLIVSYLI